MFLCITLMCSVSVCSKQMTPLWPRTSLAASCACACVHMLTCCSVSRRWRQTSRGEGVFSFLYIFFSCHCESALLLRDNCKICTPAQNTGEEENVEHISREDFCRSNWNVLPNCLVCKTCPLLTEWEQWMLRCTRCFFRKINDAFFLFCLFFCYILQESLFEQKLCREKKLVIIIFSYQCNDYFCQT